MTGYFINSPYDRWLEHQPLDYLNDEDLKQQQEEELWEQADLEYDKKKDEAVEKYFKELEDKANGLNN